MPIDLSKHKESFLSEANAHVSLVNQALIELEKSPEDEKLIQEIMRAVHTLKSLADTMGFKQTTTLCHTIEDVVEGLREGSIQLTDSADLLFACFDHLTATLKSIARNKPELDSQQLISNLNILLRGEKLTEKYIQQKVKPTTELEKINAIVVQVEQLDILMNIAEELLVNKMRLDAMRDKVEQADFLPTVESLGRLIKELQHHVMQVRLVPLQFVFNRFLRIIRDLSKYQGKEIVFETSGGDIELDRLLIDELGGSLSHIIRNAIDHGIELPEERIKKNKSPQGYIYLRASRTKETAIIEICDDGRGLNIDAIKAKALQKKILRMPASADEIINTIFYELSTASEITATSGRGMGLMIVKQKIESIGGTIRVESTPNKGTTFFIEIPLTLAIVKILLVRVGENMYALPVESVERLLSVPEEEMQGLLDLPAIIYREASIPLLDLGKLFNEKKLNSSTRQAIVIVHKGEDYVGLAVDALLATQDIIIKPLSKTMKTNIFSGVALSGTGQMILIIDVASLIAVTQRELGVA